MPADEDDAFACISRAVQAQPRATDASCPSWLERMLMYDVVALDELADWLNAGPLSREGWRANVTAGDVKKWAEQRGVLCVLSAEQQGRR